MANILSLDSVSFKYKNRVILEGVSLSVEAGTSVAIMGQSGSGKSTLLSLVAGLLRPTRGRVLIQDRDIAKITASEKARMRRESLGFVYQFGELLPALNAIENVAIPALFNNESWDSAASRASELLHRFGVDNVSVPAHVLSGGERQRVALARALINDAPLIIADEPTGALDTTLRDGVADELFNNSRKEGRGLLLVTHDPQLAARADRSFILENGQLWSHDEVPQ
ncbi:ABC transporter ATP-binding protein [Jonesia quinghaiensis]|uniref:ABC transporter ATP-binding protein n=1 Tax=Jonesia quinghaiensis TaxID=262806 RepID=UPI00056055AE|nr:ABC transporter ATP-binding protein [Jonesia quinghaiensis]